MRGIYSSVTDIRRQVFTEVARMAYEGGDYSRVEELPYKILPGEVSKYRDSIFLERAIVGERLRLSMGLPLRPIDEHAPLSTGIEEAARPEKYYEPPLINIIKFACNACPPKEIRVSSNCQGCLSHPCLPGKIFSRDGYVPGLPGTSLRGSMSQGRGVHRARQKRYRPEQVRQVRAVRQRMPLRRHP